MSLDTSKVVLSPLYRSRIDKLHADKLEINNIKMKVFDHLDFDDWGFVYFPDYRFEPIIEDPSGKVFGYRAICKNFRKYLEEIPQYVNTASALGGAWIGQLTDTCPIHIPDEDNVPADVRECWHKYHTYPGFTGMNHTAGDINIGLELGWGGILQKLRKYRVLNDPQDPAFYDGEEDLVLGIQAWVRRIARHARDMAERESDPDTAKNLSEIADMNEWLVDNPPRTFREACQFLAHFQSVDRMYYVGGALDQLDEKLRPYYERDTQAGILTDEQAVWCIASLFFNDTHYSQIAGLTPDGSRDMTSRMSFIVLDAMHAIKIPVNIAIRVSDKLNETLLRRSLEYTIEDGTGVDYSCNIGIEQGYTRNGYPEGLARQRIKVGCNWCCICGHEYPLQDVTRANMGFALYWALQDIRKESERSTERLFELFCKHVGIIVDSIKIGYDRHYEIMGRDRPEVVYNLFMHGPIERGLNCSEGGVDILNFNIDGIALATCADSFAAIEQRIEQEGRITWDQLFEVLDRNYEGFEDVRLMMKNIKRFGSPDSPAEKWALRIRDCFVDACRHEGTPKHHLTIIPGLFSHGAIGEYGSRLPATPNGRRNFEPISHSNEPDPGFAQGLNTFSPSLKANAVAIAQPGFGNSAPLHLDIDVDMVRKEGGIEALMALIHTHNHRGGTLINLNCLTKEILLEAHADPSTHPDLLVRVTGYSAFFASLSKDYRQQIVDRFLSKTQS
ncbi:MAG: pyruvate-formate lyase [Clostridia bacterium]|nr:pyruvate-formate lyase [Clostridia bacterium]